MSDELRRQAAAQGYRLVPVRKLKEPMTQVAHALAFHGVEAVVDGGANEGQFALALREAGWAGPILSVEPAPQAHRRLAAAAEGDPLWHVAPRLALGAADGDGVLEVSAESDMSSLLPQSGRLRRISPSSALVERIPVEMRRLDGLAAVRELAADRLFLKLDLQGGEAPALEGAAGLMTRVIGVQIEMALVTLYEGERRWLETIAHLAGLGFAPHLLLPGYYERKLGRQLQLDGVFFREPPDPSEAAT